MKHKAEDYECFVAAGDMAWTDKGFVNPTVFHVRDKNDTFIGSFTLAPMPGNCGIVVSTATWLPARVRGSGLSYVLHHFKEDIARKAGYSIMLCTVVQGNEPQVKGATNVGWKFWYRFMNRRTNNVCEIGVKIL